MANCLVNQLLKVNYLPSSYATMDDINITVTHPVPFQPSPFATFLIWIIGIPVRYWRTFNPQSFLIEPNNILLQIV
jgi:hypothetical protein